MDEFLEIQERIKREDEARKRASLRNVEDFERKKAERAESFFSVANFVVTRLREQGAQPELVLSGEATYDRLSLGQRDYRGWMLWHRLGTVDRYGWAPRQSVQGCLLSEDTKLISFRNTSANLEDNVFDGSRPLIFGTVHEFDKENYDSMYDIVPEERKQHLVRLAIRNNIDLAER